MLPARIVKNRIEAGCDEVGRGCLSGPVAAAAVILPPNFKHEKLNDSKKISAKTREELRLLIEAEAIAWKVCFVNAQTIDRINILRASFLAMERAVLGLKLQPEHLLIDGNRFWSSLDIPHTCVIKGDGKFGSIAAASILAKCYRDEYMERLGAMHPEFDWGRNVGYPTPKHKLALKNHPHTEFHRKSFRWGTEEPVLTPKEESSK